MIGVTKPENQPIENVVLHFNALTGKYMETKSIHETQKHKWIDENTLELKIKVVLNYELERLILSYGESVKVICKETERAIQKMIKFSKQIVPVEKNIMLALTSTVLKQVMSNYE